MQYPAFSSFRELMTTWDNYLLYEKNESKLNALLDNFTIYFEKDKEIFGSTEESRVVFARLKNPDKETSKDWEKEANFSAQNLSKTIHNEPSQHVFGKKDLNKIKIIDREQALQKLRGDSQDFSFDDVSEKDPTNFIQTIEKQR